MTTTIARWTIDEYHRMLAAGLLVDRRVELLNGLIVDMSPEGPDHADLSTEAMKLFLSAANGQYRVRAGKPITVFSSDSEPEPDLALVKPQSYRQAHSLPNDVYLIVEFSRSSLSKDTEEKRQIYASANIQEYWVANLRDRQLIIYRSPTHGDYQSQQQMTTGSISPLAFPNVKVQARSLS